MGTKKGQRRKTARRAYAPKKVRWTPNFATTRDLTFIKESNTIQGLNIPRRKLKIWK